MPSFPPHFPRVAQRHHCMRDRAAVRDELLVGLAVARGWVQEGKGARDSQTPTPHTPAMRRCTNMPAFVLATHSLAGTHECIPTASPLYCWHALPCLCRRQAPTRTSTAHSTSAAPQHRARRACAAAGRQRVPGQRAGEYLPRAAQTLPAPLPAPLPPCLHVRPCMAWPPA